MSNTVEKILINTIFGLSVLCVVGILILVGILIWSLLTYKEPVCLDRAAITELGSCNEYGICGVMTDKGKAMAQLPVVGEKICIKWEGNRRGTN